MTDFGIFLRFLAAALALSWCIGGAQAQVASRADIDPITGDYIAAVVNSDLVTAGEVVQRVARLRAAAQRAGSAVPSDAELRREALDGLIEDRVIVTFARDSGIKVDDAELDRAVQSVAAQNQWTLDQLRERLRIEGLDYARFRANLRDQILVERVREREVGQRTRVTDTEIDDYLAKQHHAKVKTLELNIAQILVAVPEGADAQTVEQRTARAQSAFDRVRGGEDFGAVARAVSDDGNHANGGEIGLKPADRLPDPFVAAVRDLRPGQIAPQMLRTGAGWHILKLLERHEETGVRVTQTRVRHILLRPSEQVSVAVATQRLLDYRQQIMSGANTFENLARLHSEDGSAATGGDLGWVSPGALVPEFEQAMDALPVGGLSQPVVSRFGVHLIQVLERREVTLDQKQVREQARTALRSQKFEQAYREWVAELRSRAYIELRDPPQ